VALFIVVEEEEEEAEDDGRREVVADDFVACDDADEVCAFPSSRLEALAKFITNSSLCLGAT
jgi:MinD superfamily P-loop ATPase